MVDRSDGPFVRLFFPSLLRSLVGWLVDSLVCVLHALNKNALNYTDFSLLAHRGLDFNHMLHTGSSLDPPTATGVKIDRLNRTALLYFSPRSGFITAIRERCTHSTVFVWSHGVKGRTPTLAVCESKLVWAINDFWE